MWTKYNNLRYVLCVALALLPLGGRGATPVPKPLTLANALGTVPPPTGVVWLTVGAEQITLPKDAAPPPPAASLADTLDAFQYASQTFGAVTALAPSTMAVLNEDPVPPDVTADLPPFIAFQLLAARLNDTQWQALISERGLGLTDLDDDTQRGLFHVLFPHGKLLLASTDPEMQKLPADKRTDIQDVSDQIDSARLRVGQSSHIYLQDQSGKTIYYSAGAGDEKPHLRVFSKHRETPVAAHTVTLRAVVPNAPKPGDLSYSQSALHVAVPLTGLNTVGDLITRIASASHLEIYCDPHYAARSLRVLGPYKAALASDLLPSVALCVTGTFRRVGPAYVLTDDLSGVGARREKLSDWNDQADYLREQMTDKAGQALLTKHGKDARSLQGFGDPLAMTPQQMKTQKESDLMPGIPSDAPVSWSSLTPAQHDQAQRIAEDYNAQLAAGTLPEYLERRNLGPVDTAGKVQLRPDAQVQLLLPSLSEPVQTSYSLGEMYLFWPGYEAAMAQVAKLAKEKKPPLQPPAPPLAQALHLGKRRAVVGHPRTATEVDALIAAMQTLGLNELWLDVFSHGVAHIPGSAPTGAAPSSGPDILTEAIARAKPAGIAVYANLDFLAGGDNPPAAARNLNILGETTTEAAVRKHAQAPQPDFDDDGKLKPFTLPDVEVTPAGAQDTLAALVRTLVGVSGLAGLVWQNAQTDDALGYTPALRLAFLRAAHADPIDLTAQHYLNFDVSLPQFDDDGAETALHSQWDDLRQQVNIAMLQAVRQAMPTASPARPLLMEVGGGRSIWFASWDNAAQTPPPFVSAPDDAWKMTPAQRAATAKAGSHTVLLSLSVAADEDAEQLAWQLKKSMTPALDGYVLEFDSEDDTRGASPLSALVQAVQSEKH